MRQKAFRVITIGTEAAFLEAQTYHSGCACAWGIWGGVRSEGRGRRETVRSRRRYGSYKRKERVISQQLQIFVTTLAGEKRRGFRGINDI